MKRIKLKWFDKCAIALCVFLFACLLGFRLYLAGFPYTQICPVHKVSMRRAWIQKEYRPINEKKALLRAATTGCGPELVQAWWGYYFYCPKGSGCE